MLLKSCKCSGRWIGSYSDCFRSESSAAIHWTVAWLKCTFTITTSNLWQVKQCSSSGCEKMTEQIQNVPELLFNVVTALWEEPNSLGFNEQNPAKAAEYKVQFYLYNIKLHKMETQVKYKYFTCVLYYFLLYLNLFSHSGALNHLSSLRLLFLHNNQIRGLDDTMHELRRMQQLRTASEFHHSKDRALSVLFPF